MFRRFSVFYISILFDWGASLSKGICKVGFESLDYEGTSFFIGFVETSVVFA
jgi:hypothetical protein